jgi:class 3 adenylate cyclase
MRRGRRSSASRPASATIGRAERAALGGARLPVAVLFGDIRGLPAWPNRRGLEEIAALLGEYYAAMIDAVFDHQAPTSSPATDHGGVARAARRRGRSRAVRRARCGASLPGRKIADAARGSRSSKPLRLSYGTVFAGNIGSGASSTPWWATR